MAIQHINQQTLAERWQVSETTLERWRSIGVGPAFLKLQGRIVYREQDLEAYEQQCLRQSTAQRATSGAFQQSSNQPSSFA
jgi:predicted site-specific integrase-resolvase